MGQTTDRNPGPRLEEKIIFTTDEGFTADAAGEMVYAGGAFSMRDSTGVFDPRSGSGISETQHKTLRQLIHFIEDGPAEGFTSGAYREITGTIFPTAIIWYTDSGKTDKIVERLITWSGVTATVDKWKIYDTDGSTVLWTVSDAISYSGVFETSRTRTITSGDA